MRRKHGWSAVLLSLVEAATAPAHAQDEGRRFRTGQIEVGDRITIRVIPERTDTDTCTVTGIRDTPAPDPATTATSCVAATAAA